MIKQALFAISLAAAIPASFAQSAGSSLGTPTTPGGWQLPSTGTFARPGDTTLPGTPTTPGLSTLPGAPRDSGNFGTSPIPPSTPGPSVLPSYTDPLDRNSSLGATRPPLGLEGTAPRPSTSNCIPGSITRPC